METEGCTHVVTHIQCMLSICRGFSWRLPQRDEYPLKSFSPFQVLVEDDESLDLVNQLGLENLVAVKTTESSSSSSSADSVVTTTVAAQLGLSTSVTASASEVNVYVIAESEKGRSAGNISIESIRESLIVYDILQFFVLDGV